MQHDIFICHASEDKPDLVRSLVAALQEQQIDVWYDEISIEYGASLRQAIDRGLAEARYGLVVLSPAFFAKPWTQWEPTASFHG
ncbi:toll/interleukin-1 receptor domain-containing protein [Caulobacter segnis]